MAGQHHTHRLGEQGRHRDPFGLHLLIKSIEFVGGDGVAHVETGHLQAGQHVAVHRLLQGVEGGGFTGLTKGLAHRSRRCGDSLAVAGGWSHGRARALGHAGDAGGLASGGKHVFALDTPMGTAAAEGAEGNAQLGSELFGPRRGHHLPIGWCDRRNRHRNRHWNRHWSGGHHGSRSNGRRGNGNGGRRRGWQRSCGGGGGGLGLNASDFRLRFHNQTNRFAHRRRAPRRHQHRRQEALVKRLHIHIGLIGLHHQHRLAPAHPVARFFEPLHDLALRHRGAEGGHEDLVGRQSGVSAWGLRW